MPEWREVLTLDIHRGTDEIAIQIINNFNDKKDVLAEKRFKLCEIDRQQSPDG